MRIRFQSNILSSIHKIAGKRENFTFWWFFLILIAKTIRYTMLKVTLVNASIGHRMLHHIVNKTARFSIFAHSEDELSYISPTDTATYIFQTLNILRLNTYVSFEIFITILYNLIVFAMLQKCIKKYTTFQAIFLICSIMQLNIFAFNLAKEPIQMLYFILIFWILQSNFRNSRKIFWTFISVLLSVVTFRKYYILMLYFGVMFYLLCSISKKNNTKSGIMKWFVILIIMVVSYFVLLVAAQRLSPDNYSELIRVRLRRSQAVTDIRTLFYAQGIVLFVADYLILIIRLLFPVELLRFGVKYAVYAASQIIITIVYFDALIIYEDADFSRKLAICIFTGFLFMSATFEPDFGSWVRHESVVFPVTLIMGGFLPYKAEGKRRKMKNVKLF